MMFSNSTEGEMFTREWCSNCIHAFDGDQLCDEAAVILSGEEPPAFLVRTTPSRENPVGVTCELFEAT